MTPPTPADVTLELHPESAEIYFVLRRQAGGAPAAVVHFSLAQASELIVAFTKAVQALSPAP